VISAAELRVASLVRSLLLLLLLLGTLAAAPVAQADCGGVQIARPPKQHRTYLAPLAIGDSTMIFALPKLAAEGFTANARGCRQFPEAIALLIALRHAHSLPHLVVIALGANGSVTDADVRETLAVLGHRRQLVLVTPREAGGGSGSDAATVRAEAHRRPAQVHALDWVAYSAGHPSWFQPDRLHLTFAGAAAFARLLGQVLALAPPPGHAPAGSPGGSSRSPGGSIGGAPTVPAPTGRPTRPSPKPAAAQPGSGRPPPPQPLVAASPIGQVTPVPPRPQ
jgi:hypothetical protein